MNKVSLFRIVSSFMLFCIVTLFANNSFAACRSDGIDLQILGSGGPFGAGKRASSGYLVWINGVARVMVDAGGGTFLRFHEAEASVETLDILAISHLHPDHSSEIPALFWAQGASTPIAGPSGSENLPSISEFMKSMFQSEQAAFRILGSLRESDVIEIDASGRSSTIVLENDEYTLLGIGVPHGTNPTIGYRIDIGNRSIAFASDQTGTNEEFTRLIQEVDILVAHFAASETSEGVPAALHAKPSVWARMAKEGNVSHLVLSHLSNTDEDHDRYNDHTGSDLSRNVDIVRQTYSGSITIADDLMCIPL